MIRGVGVCDSPHDAHGDERVKSQLNATDTQRTLFACACVCESYFVCFCLLFSTPQWARRTRKRPVSINSRRSPRRLVRTGAPRMLTALRRPCHALRLLCDFLPHRLSFADCVICLCTCDSCMSAMCGVDDDCLAGVCEGCQGGRRRDHPRPPLRAFLSRSLPLAATTALANAFAIVLSPRQQWTAPCIICAHCWR